MFNAPLITLLDGPYAPWLPAFVLLILFATAAWDARTGIVPNLPLLFGALAIGIGRYLANGWEDALIYLAMGVGAGAIIWGLNEIWFKVFKKDAVGMGDAKWTALAVATFGPAAGLVFAWFAGAWVSIIWIIGCYAVGNRIAKVYFAPFLFCGMLIGLLIVRGVVVLPFRLFI
jgi:hypothetical protein